MTTTQATSQFFEPCQPLLEGRALPDCRASVCIPVCNEEASLASCLDAFTTQVEVDANPLPPDSFEILLLLNNCTDRSREVVETWSRQHPAVRLHWAELRITGSRAHVGTARRLLMDTAWYRLGGAKSRASQVLLTTDADSVVAPTWIAHNLRAIDEGADAVGGAIRLRAADLDTLPAALRVCYERDRRYAVLISELEDLLDPQPGDPCPRHLDHFGSSLACTAPMYARSGGMPPVSPLEDQAFIDQLRRVGARIRHEPAVWIYTSARIDGRASVGFAGQLRLWSELPHPEAHTVQSASLTAHRFRTLKALRDVFHHRSVAYLPENLADRAKAIALAVRREDTLTGFLIAVECDRLVMETFAGVKEEPIVQAIATMEAQVAALGDSGRALKDGDPVVLA